MGFLSPSADIWRHLNAYTVCSSQAMKKKMDFIFWRKPLRNMFLKKGFHKDEALLKADGNININIKNSP